MVPVRVRGALAALCSSSLVIALTGCPAPGSPDAGPMLHVASPAWQDQIIYFVFTDRFANGDPSNDDQDAGEFDPANKDKYSGGDLQGIIDHLDYIQGLGATAVWITPPVANMWWDPEQGSGGYHGYWARNLKKVDEHLGTLETYQKLSDALHRRGMYLIQDVVPNHMGNFFSYRSCDDAGLNCGSRYDPACDADYTAQGCDVSKDVHLNVHAVPGSKPDQAPFDQNDPSDPAQRAAGIYHWTPQIEDYNNTYQHWFWAISDLDDLNSENPVVRSALRDSYGYWIKEVGVDGFRVDTASFAPHDFWNDFFYSTDATAPGIMNVAKATGRAQFHAFGEIANTSGPLDDSAEQYIAPYFGTAAKPEFPAILGYPLFGEINGVFAQGNPTANMTYRLRSFMDPALNPSPYLTPTFIDNHDQSRFLSVSNGDALVQAVYFIFSIPGIPTVYYGTEQGFTVTRQAMFDGGYGNQGDAFRPQVGLYKIIKQLSDLRRQHPVLTRGTLDVLADSATGPGGLVLRRQYQGDTVLVFMNTSDKSALVANMPSGLAAGTVLESWQTYDSSGASLAPPLVGPDGGITVQLHARDVIVAHATNQVVAPSPPGAVITVTTAIEGQTFTGDTVISGTLSPASATLKMLVDGNLDGATAVTVQGDGSWSSTLPVSQFAVGSQPHTVSFYAQAANVSTPVYHFTSNVAFNGLVQSHDDPAGDDHGPTGYSYIYPGDSSFNHQQDLLNVTALVGATTMKLQLTMANVTTVWSPDLGFDHVVFDIFFQVPGGGGASALPYLSATGPSGFTWNFGQFTSGYKADNKMFTSVGATASSPGTLITGPKVSVAGRVITFEYDRNTLGLSTWTGTQVYVTTWDYDGVQKIFRPISQAGGPYEYGHGDPGNPHIMDDLPPFTLTGP
jgi:glycosidase